MKRSCAARMRQLLWHVFHRVSQSRLRVSVPAARARQSWQGLATAARIRSSQLLPRSIAGSVSVTPLAPTVRELRNASARQPPLALWFPAAAAAAARRVDCRRRVDCFQRRYHCLLLRSAHRQQRRDQHGSAGTHRLRLCQLQRERHQEC